MSDWVKQQNNYYRYCGIYKSNCRDVNQEALTGTMGIAERIVKKVCCDACDIFAEF